MLISIEGMDGVGKSSVLSHVSSSLEIPIVEKPMKRLLSLDDSHSREITHKIYGKYSKNIQAMYYLMGYLTVLEDSKKEDLLLDRGFMSTYYFSYCEETATVFDMFVYNYGLPDVTILLYASIEERIKRIKDRNASDNDLKKQRIYTDGYDKHFEAIKKYNIPCLVINTENLSVTETSNLVLKIINMVKNNRNTLDVLKEIFSIDNIDSMENFSFQYINQLIDSQISSNVSNEKVKVLVKRSDNNETNSY